MIVLIKIGENGEKEDSKRLNKTAKHVKFLV